MRNLIIIVIISMSLMQLSIATETDGSLEDIPTKRDTIQCEYNQESQMLNCFRKSAELECEADFKWYNADDEFKYFGIGKWEDSSAEMKFRLVPRKLDNTAWVKDYIKLNGVNKYFSLYYSEKINDFGLKVKDSKCFDKIVDFFKNSPRNEKVFIESDSEKEPYTILLVGDLVFVNDELKSKRWYGWYGYGWPYSYGYGGYGYGGYGGYGYGYYKRNIEEKEPITVLEEKFEQLEKEMRKGWAIADQNTELMIKDLKFFKKDLEMFKADAEKLDASSKKASSMWTKPMKHNKNSL